MKLSTAIPLILILLFPSTTPSADDATAEGALVLLDSELRAEPNHASASLARIASGSNVNILGRNGLWMFVTSGDSAAPARGWIRVTALRLTGVNAKAATADSQAGSGFARLSRSVGSLFGGLRGRETRSTQVATIGIRGLTPGELNTAQFDQGALDAVAAWSANAADAEYFAAAGGLARRQVAGGDLLPRGAEAGQ